MTPDTPTAAEIPSESLPLLLFPVSTLLLTVSTWPFLSAETRQLLVFLHLLALTLLTKKTP